MANIIATRYKAGAFVPLSPASIQDSFTDGEIYYVKVDKKRYMPRHDWFMTLIRESWETLPDDLREKFPSPDILRKRLLISAGYADIRSIVCSTDAEAKKFAIFIGGSLDDYTIMSVQGNIIVLATAKSQAVNNMDADTFIQSCDNVLNELALLLGTSKDTLKARAIALQAPKRAQRQGTAPSAP